MSMIFMNRFYVGNENKAQTCAPKQECDIEEGNLVGNPQFM